MEHCEDGKHEEGEAAEHFADPREAYTRTACESGRARTEGQGEGTEGLKEQDQRLEHETVLLRNSQRLKILRPH